MQLGQPAASFWATWSHIAECMLQVLSTEVGVKVRLSQERKEMKIPTLRKCNSDVREKSGMRFSLLARFVIGLVWCHFIRATKLIFFM